MFNIVTAAVALTLTVLAMGAFVRCYAPKPRPPDTDLATDYDRHAMRAALSVREVESALNVVLSFGSRFIGQPGYVRAAEYVRRAFEQAGLETYELNLETPAPVTLRREILDVSGRPLGDVEIYPFFPNHVQPMVTPTNGLTGRLVLMTPEELATRQRFDDCIAVLDPLAPPPIYGLRWTSYAQLGVRAVIVAPRGGWEQLKIEQWHQINQNMLSHEPINFVRLMATSDIYRHLGETVTLHVQTAIRPIANTVLVGVMRSSQPAAEAVVIRAGYDAYSILPDRAPGVIQAHGLVQMLQALKGLQAYRTSLLRDVIFIATGTDVMACEADSQLLAAMGPRLGRENTRAEIERRRVAEQERARWVNELRGLIEQPGFLDDRSATVQAMQSVTGPMRRFFDEQLRHVLNTLVMVDNEQVLQARIPVVAEGLRDVHHPLYQVYLAAKRRYDDSFSAAGYSLERLMQVRLDTVKERQLRDRLRERFAELAEHHARRERYRQQQLAIHDLFARYREIVVLRPRLVPFAKNTETVSFHLGPGVVHRINGPLISRHLFSVRQLMEREGQDVPELITYSPQFAQQTDSAMAHVPPSAHFWNQFWYPAFDLIYPDRPDAYLSAALPVELPFMREATTIQRGLALWAETVLYYAHGNGRFAEPGWASPLVAHGTVYVGGIGESVIPNYTLAGALVGSKGPEFHHNGHFRRLFLVTDAYGNYELLSAPSGFFAGWGHQFFAAAYGADGVIAHVNDEGATAQSLYRTAGISLYGGVTKPIHFILFRAAPVTVLDVANPQTMKQYSGLDFDRADTLTPFGSFNLCRTDGPVTIFLPPDQRFIVRLKAGAPDNELVQTTRAVMMNTHPDEPAAGLATVNARGYLVAHHPLLQWEALETARSMLSLNSPRLEALQRYRMADRRTIEFHENARTLWQRAEQPERPLADVLEDARGSATYSILNYPIIRGAIYDAVVGIIWYLFLLVPFVFFFERLVFGFADIRLQLTANAIIFVVVFALLAVLHPAFAMIRSSLMILLGFIILLISLGVIALVSGRFRENLEALRRKRAQVEAAEVNTIGVIGTAFALGLNNMHRRKVRTGLTCATLVLITFAMLCFSSLHSDVVDMVTPTGPAPYNGLLVKPPQFRPVSSDEKFALDRRYGRKYNVVARQMYVGMQTWERETFNPALTMQHTTSEGETRKVSFKSLILLNALEPLGARLPLLTKTGWLPKVSELTDTPVLISAPMARQLGITVARVEQQPQPVTINGRPFVVWGIFEPADLASLTDLDGRNLLPFDVTAMTELRPTAPGRFWEIIADENAPLIDPALVAITRDDLVGFHVPYGFLRMVSVAVDMGSAPYAEVREEINRYLEQTGRAVYYGLGGIAYLGRRSREITAEGMLDLLIPLFIAAITVLNTMRGSVYERRDEIFVYNAVGIAPRYVFFMFMAEALVYSVVGTVVGYLLAQGTGSVLTALDWTGGVQLNFTSRMTVYVSATIIGATLLSTYFPARAALRIAAPSEDVGWKLPAPEGDRLSFALPFTFSHRDRIAILAFFHRYFLDHGEGSAGRFYAGPPQLGLAEQPDPLQPECPIPEIRCTIWLKPFDLGVSQELVIHMQTDPETREYIAMIRLERLSGTREAWMRLNHGFVAQIRRHFLHWRAVDAGQRAELFEEAKQLLDAQLGVPAHATDR
ncbi:MAG: ABC transporter permease [Verrucomicrobiae bacterium]|nr:ABC transporter permease [Verrucomicrobiae bacterium]